jgi:hypothetical protein
MPQIKSATTGPTAEPVDEFEDARGRWIWIEAACERYGLSPSTLAEWRGRGSPWLAPSSPRLRKLQTCKRGGDGRRSRTYVLVTEVERIVATLAATSAADVGWLSMPEAIRVFGVSEGLLTTYAVRKPHPLLGRKIRSELRKYPDGRRSVRRRFYLVADLQKIAAARDTGRKATVVGAWVSTPDATDKYGYGSPTLLYW